MSGFVLQEMEGSRSAPSVVVHLIHPQDAIEPEGKHASSTNYSNDIVVAAFQSYGFIGVMLRSHTMADLSQAPEKTVRGEMSVTQEQKKV